MTPSLHGRGHVGWVNPETFGKLHRMGPWHYYLIIFSSLRKQMGLPDLDFYLPFLSKVPRGFLPQTYSDGEKRAIPIHLLLEAPVCLNNLIPCFFFLFFIFLEIREIFISFCSNRVKNYDGCHEGPTIYILGEKNPTNKQKNQSENTLWPPPASPSPGCWKGWPGTVAEILLPLGKLLWSSGGSIAAWRTQQNPTQGRHQLTTNWEAFLIKLNGEWNCLPAYLMLSCHVCFPAIKQNWPESIPLGPRACHSLAFICHFNSCFLGLLISPAVIGTYHFQYFTTVLTSGC